MKKLVFYFFASLILGAIPGIPQQVVRNYAAFSSVQGMGSLSSSYKRYLSLGYMALATTPHGLIRQPDDYYAGDYFWPPDAFQFIYPDSSNFGKSLESDERAQIAALIRQHYSSRFSDTSIIASLKGYYYEFHSGSYQFDCGPRREFYTMFAEGDTVYVISGSFGKFMSFYRATPGDSRLNPEKFLAQVKQLSSLTEELKISAADFYRQDDTDNYFLEYVNRDALVRVRNYQLMAVLPPADPESKTRTKYNLIEITKILDGSIIPPRR